MVRGLPASAGEIEGPAKFLYTVDEKTDWNEGDILISRFTSPEWMNVLTKVGGVVTAFGGLLSHTAIVARELGVSECKQVYYENTVATFLSAPLCLKSAVAGFQR